MNGAADTELDTRDTAAETAAPVDETDPGAGAPPAGTEVASLSLDAGDLDASALLRVTVLSNEIREDLAELEPTATFPGGELDDALVDQLLPFLASLPEPLLSELEGLLGPAVDPRQASVLELRLRARKLFGWTNALLQAVQNDLTVWINADAIDPDVLARVVGDPENEIVRDGDLDGDGPGTPVRAAGGGYL